MEIIGLFVFLISSIYYVQAITNGNLTQISEYPYAVSIQRLPTNLAVPTRGHVCGGALVRLGHVLTSATCCYEYIETTQQYVRKLPANYRVFAGATQLTDDTPDRWRGVHSFTPHPDYIHPPSHFHDIAVVTLANLFPANIGLVPLVVASSSSWSPPTEAPCVVAGWGAFDNTGTPSVQIRNARKYVFDQQMCTLIYSVLNPHQLNIFNTMMCANTFDLNINSNMYDEGNILVCGNNVPSGVLMYYPGEGAVAWPEVFTRVSNYTTWIRSVTGSANVFTPGLAIIVFASLINMMTGSIMS